MCHTGLFSLALTVLHMKCLNRKAIELLLLLERLTYPPQSTAHREHIWSGSYEEVVLPTERAFKIPRSVP